MKEENKKYKMKKNKNQNIKIIKVFLKLNKYAGYHTGKCNRIQVNERSIIKKQTKTTKTIILYIKTIPLYKLIAYQLIHKSKVKKSFV